MVHVVHRNVHTVKKRKKDGTIATYYYHRRTRERLPDDPTSPEFAAALKVSFIPDPLAEDKTLEGLIRKYLASSDFKKLKPNSQQAYRIMLNKLRLKHIRYAPITSFRKRHIREWRDSMAEKPGTANLFVSVVRTLFKYAVDCEYRDDNPAAEIPPLPMGEYQPWPEAAIKKFTESAPAELVLALKVGLYTGQRLGDCIAMRWSQYDGEGLTLTQQKTGAELWIPCHNELRKALNAAKRKAKGLHILTTKTGQPWTRRTFGWAFYTAVKAAKIGDYQFHGLRKTAASKLAEAGCSDREIQSITGHASVHMVSHYVKKADQKLRARSAMKKLENAG